LAARLKHLLFAWRFSRKVNGFLAVNWPQRDKSLYNTLGTEYYSPSLIFDLGKIVSSDLRDEIAFIEGNVGDDKMFAKFPPDRLPDIFLHKTSLTDAQTITGSYISDSYFIRLEGELKKDVENEVRELFDYLPKSPALVKQISAAHQAIGSEKYTALHLRRGDIPAVLRAATAEMQNGVLTSVAKNYAIHLTKQTAPFHYYYADIEKAIGDGERVLFFSDSPDLVSHFSDKYKDYIVDAARIGSDIVFPLQKAFLDFTLIGKSDRVIGTQTGFASVACLLGGARHDIVTARGTWDVFLKYVYDEILEGSPIPAKVQKEIEGAMFGEYDKYYQRATKLGINI
jgi:hypothetical protein